MAAVTRLKAQSLAQIQRKQSIETPPKANEISDSMMDEIRRMHQETNREIQKSREELKMEFKTELGGVLTKLDGIEDELKTIKGKVRKLEIDSGKIETKMELLQKEQKDDQEMMLRISLKQRENCIKLRGLPEKENENLYTYLAPILAKFINESETLFPWEIDRIYRVNSYIARTKHLPRDIVIYFVRQQTKNMILHQSSKTKLMVEGKEILILRDIPGKILKKRRDYYFLTSRLKSCRIPFKWDEIEGVMVSWKSKKMRINSVEKAKTLLKDIEEEIKKTKNDEEVDDQRRRREERREGEESEKGEGFERSF